MPYGIDVPVIHAFAAIRHQEPAREFVLLIDEVEAHLSSNDSATHP